MRVTQPARTPEIVIDVNLDQYSVVDRTICKRGGEPATAWNYVGGIQNGNVFHAIETTGGIAENAPDIFLVDVRVFNELGMMRLPTSTERNPLLCAVVDRIQVLMAHNLELMVKEDLENIRKTHGDKGSDTESRGENV